MSASLADRPGIHSTEKHLSAAVDFGSKQSMEVQVGVRKVQALRLVWGVKAKIGIYVAIALASYMAILDNGTNYAWGSYASAQLGHYALYAAIQCVQAILLAVGKPLFAKLTDAAGRAETVLLALIMYVIGYIISAATPSMAGLGAGNAIWVLGFSGLQITLQIVIADITDLRWRGLVSGLATGGWYFVNFYANGKISAAIVAGPGWRWGYGIYAMCYVPALLPLIVILFWAQQQPSQNYEKTATVATTYYERVILFARETDAIGLFLLAATLALIFLPIVLAGGAYATTTWHNSEIPVMMSIGGGVLLPAFIYFEVRRASFPVFPVRLLRNRNVLAMCAINLFDFISFYLSFSQLYAYVAANTNWSYQNIIYYTNAQSLSLTFFGVLWSIVVLLYHIGFKWGLVSALCIRLLGVGLMLHARQRGGGTTELVLTQIIQGAGGGIAAVASQVAAQGSVPHQDLAIATAVVLLSAELGNVIGTAAAGAINRGRLPHEIARRFPLLNSTQIDQFVNSPGLVAITYPDLKSPERLLFHDAFAAVQRDLLIPALVLAIVPIIASLLTDNFKLTSIQNVQEGQRSRTEESEIDVEVGAPGDNNQGEKVRSTTD